MQIVNGDYLETGVAKLFYSVKGYGYPIVFIHGNFNDSRIWEYQIQTLSKYFKTIRYDLRGYGKSETPAESFSNEVDLKTLLEGLGADKVILVGSSSGGGVAADFTLKYPDAVKSLILVSPSITGCRYPFRLTLEAMKCISSLRSRGFDYAIENFISNPFWQYLIPSDDNPSAKALVLQVLKTQKNFYSWNFKLSLRLKPYAVKRLGDIHVPTLIIMSDKDKPFNLAIGDYVHKNIKNSSKIIFSDCGHLPFVEKPEEFNMRVLDFIKTINT
jgi:pimeloyl-ACP methyl ester carboxylesterase